MYSGNNCTFEITNIAQGKKRLQEYNSINKSNLKKKMAYAQGVKGNENRNQHGGKQPAKDRSNQATKRKPTEPESSESEREKSEDNDKFEPPVTCAVQRKNKHLLSNKTKSIHSKCSGLY